LPKYDFASQRPIGEVSVARRLFEDPTRNAGVRPYQVGDPLQRVHWRATARTGELQCRVFEPTTLAGASILVDFHKDGFHSRGEPFRSDLLVTTACSSRLCGGDAQSADRLASNGCDAVTCIAISAFRARMTTWRATSARSGSREGEATRKAGVFDLSSSKRDAASSNFNTREYARLDHRWSVKRAFGP
jgi:hypothetical protein